MKSLMSVDEVKEVSTIAFGAPFSLATPLEVKREAKYI